MKKAILAVILIVPLVLASCLLDDRTVEIVLNDEHCEPFPEHHESENYTTPKDIEIGSNLDELLAQHEFSRENIESAHLMSGFYEVTEFVHDHDWLIEEATQFRNETAVA